MEVLWSLPGMAIGAAAVWLWARRPAEPPAPSPWKITTGWRLSELTAPRIVAHDMDGVEVPEGATVLASGLVDPDVLASCDVQQVPEARAAFALDTGRPRALLFLGGITPGAMAVFTSDEGVVGRLETEFRRLRDRAGPYVERRRIAELAGRSGVTVEVDGAVQDVLPYQERFLIRLEDQGAIVGVLVDKDAAELTGERIRVTGRLGKGPSGYTVVEATEIRRLR